MKLKLNRTTILSTVIIINPFIEMLFTAGESAGSLTINQMARMICMLLIVICVKKSKNWIKLIAIGMVLILCFSIWQITGKSIKSYTDLVFIIKLFSGFSTYFAFKELLLEDMLKADEIVHAFTIGAFIVSVSILLSWFGFGRNSYGDSRWGYKGLFSIQSTISIYLLMLLPVQYVWYSGKKRILLMLLNISALFSIGTKTGVICVVGYAVLIVMYHIYFILKKKKANLIFFEIGVPTISLGAIIGGIFLNNYLTLQIARFQSTSYYHSLYSFLVSNRDTQISVTRTYVTQVDSKLNLWFGFGYSKIENILQSKYRNYYAIEQDLYGLYYYCGILFLIIIISFLIITIVKSIINFFKTKEETQFCILITYLMILVCSFFGGHVLFESLSITPFYFIVAYIHVKNHEIYQERTNAKD